MKSLLLALAFVCSQAMADGALLATPAPSLSLTDPVMIEYAKNPAVVSVTSIHVNRNAMHSNIIRLNVEGKERTFIGGMKPIELTRIPCWAGKEPTPPHQPVNLLHMCSDPATGYFGGTVTTMTRTYDIVVKGGHELLVEKDTLHNGHADTAPVLQLPPGAKQ